MSSNEYEDNVKETAYLQLTDKERMFKEFLMLLELWNTDVIIIAKVSSLKNFLRKHSTRKLWLRLFILETG